MKIELEIDGNKVSIKVIDKELAKNPVLAKQIADEIAKDILSTVSPDFDMDKSEVEYHIPVNQSPAKISTSEKHQLQSKL